MRTRVEQWGHSLGIRIPEAVAEEAGLAADSSVDIVLAGRVITVTPVVEVPSLDELLAGITPENLHDEFETGPLAGNERW